MQNRKWSDESVSMGLHAVQYGLGIMSVLSLIRFRPVKASMLAFASLGLESGMIAAMSAQPASKGLAPRIAYIDDHKSPLTSFGLYASTYAKNGIKTADEFVTKKISEFKKK